MQFPLKPAVRLLYFLLGATLVCASWAGTARADSASYSVAQQQFYLPAAYANAASFGGGLAVSTLATAISDPLFVALPLAGQSADKVLKGTVDQLPGYFSGGKLTKITEHGTDWQVSYVRTDGTAFSGLFTVQGTTALYGVLYTDATYATAADLFAYAAQHALTQPGSPVVVKPVQKPASLWLWPGLGFLVLLVAGFLIKLNLSRRLPKRS